MDDVTSISMKGLDVADASVRYINAEWRDKDESPRIGSKETRRANTSFQPIKVHNARPRFATSLLYLRCPERGGGETLFGSDAEAGAVLLAEGAESTLDDAAARHHETVRALEASARPLVPAAVGTLLLFFVRLSLSLFLQQLTSEDESVFF